MAGGQQKQTAGAPLRVLLPMEKNAFGKTLRARSGALRGRNYRLRLYRSRSRPSFSLSPLSPLSPLCLLCPDQGHHCCHHHRHHRQVICCSNSHDLFKRGRNCRSWRLISASAYSSRGAEGSGESQHENQLAKGNGGDASRAQLLLFLSKYGITVVLVAILGLSFSGQVSRRLEAVQCFLTSWALVTLLGKWATPRMNRLKQRFQEDGPRHMSKEGTPTAGGLFLVPVGLVTGLLYAWPQLAAAHQSHKIAVFGVTFSTLACSAIGLADDFLIVSKDSNKGLSPKTKLFLQVRINEVISSQFKYVIFPNSFERILFNRCSQVRYSVLRFHWITETLLRPCLS